jgi:hypothetical protein
MESGKLNMFDQDPYEQANISGSDFAMFCNEMKELKGIKDNYDFLCNFIKMTHVDVHKCDAFLEMKTFYFS